MRNQTFRRLLTFLVCVGLGMGLLAPMAEAKRKRDEPRAKTVSASGCITAGVEAGCVMLTDSGGTVYNLYFRGRKKPAVGTAIRFSGTPHDGPTTCMQGRAVNVTTWIQLKMKCVQKKSDSGGKSVVRAPCA